MLSWIFFKVLNNLQCSIHLCGCWLTRHPLFFNPTLHLAGMCNGPTCYQRAPSVEHSLPQSRCSVNTCAAELLVLTTPLRILAVFECLPPLASLLVAGALACFKGLPWASRTSLSGAQRAWHFLSPRPFLSQWLSLCTQRRQTFRYESYSQVSLEDELEAPQDSSWNRPCCLLLLPFLTPLFLEHFSCVFSLTHNPWTHHLLLGNPT